MTGSIKTITDREKFKEILQKFFSGKDTFLKTKSGDLNIQYIGFNEGNAAFRIPRVKNLPEMVLVFSRHGSSTIYATCKYIQNEGDTFILLPARFQVIAEERKETRKDLPIEGSDTNVLFVVNVMSDFLVQSILAGNEKKLENIRQSLKYDLEPKFERVRIVFVNEAKTDPRMKYIQEKVMPILIPNIGERPDEKNEHVFNTYVNEIYAKDFKLNSDKLFISEATVPLLFRSIIPFGYIQVNSKKPMNEKNLSVVKRMAIVVSEYFKKENIIMTGNERFLVSDISPSGLGIVFRDRKLTRYFRQGSLVSCEVLLPTNKKVIIGAMVRNIIFNQNGIIKVGFEIKELDALSQVNYEEYLETLEKPSE